MSTVAVFEQGITQILQAAVTGLAPMQPYTLALAASSDGRGPLEPLANFTTNPAGAAIVNAVGPIRQVIDINAAVLRRFLADAGIGADPEARATDAQFWKTAKVVLPTPKEIVTMRLDADLLRWFRRERGYQTRINAILRAYMKAQESA